MTAPLVSLPPLLYIMNGNPPLGAESFYNPEALATWIMSRLPQLRTVFLKYRGGTGLGAGGAEGEEGERGRLLAGEAAFPGRPVRFLENGVHFQADIVQGQKTGEPTRTAHFGPAQHRIDQHGPATYNRSCRAH